jgi:hypothetical protein
MLLTSRPLPGALAAGNLVFGVQEMTKHAGDCKAHVSNVSKAMIFHMGMDQYLLIQILGG